MFFARILSVIALILVNYISVLSLSLSRTYDILWDNNMNGVLVLGMGSNRQLHYAQLAFIVLLDRWPRVCASLNLGVDQYPLKVSAEHNFAKDYRGSMSIGVNPSG